MPLLLGLGQLCTNKSQILRLPKGLSSIALLLSNNFCHYTLLIGAKEIMNLDSCLVIFSHVYSKVIIYREREFGLINLWSRTSFPNEIDSLISTFSSTCLQRRTWNKRRQNLCKWKGWRDSNIEPSTCQERSLDSGVHPISLKFSEISTNNRKLKS